MRDKRLEFGIFVISIGIILLLANFGVLSWSIIDVLIDYWPVIFIVIGINIIFRNNSIVRIITWLFFLAAIIYLSFSYNGNSGGGEWIESTSSIEKMAETESGNLNLKVGGTNINLSSTENNLIDYSVKDSDVNRKIDYTDGNKNAIVTFEKKHSVIFGGNNKNMYSFKVNDNIPWDIDIDCGAVNGTLDMSNVILNNLDLDTGAGNLKLVFGEKSNSSNIKIDAGASNFDVVIPKNTGVRIKFDGGLNNTNLKNLGWIKNKDYYTSPNYNSAVNKIEMDIDMGVGRFMVTSI